MNSLLKFFTFNIFVFTTLSIQDYSYKYKTHPWKYYQHCNIYEFVRKDDVQGIKDCLDKGEDINQIHQYMGHMTPLMHATFLGKLQAVKYLWEQGADRTIPEYHGYYLMDAAAYAGKANIVQFFIDQGMDPMETHDDGFPPIFKASWGETKYHAETVRVFLNNGVSPHILAHGMNLLEVNDHPIIRDVVLEFLDYL